MRFSLLHPSRRRPLLAERAAREWHAQRSGEHECEHLLSVDDDDPELAAYRDLAERAGLVLLVHRNRSLVDAVNRAAAAASGDVLVVISDDFGCPPRWDAALAAVIGDDLDVAVLVDDAVDGRILTLPILGRDLYRALGYVYHPAYFSMYCDDDLTETARLRGCLRDARHLVFPHRHFSVAGIEPDETYARQNSGRAWLEGWRVFAKRRSGGFGSRPRTLAVTLAEARIEAEYWARRLGGPVKRRLLRLRSR